MKRTDTSVTEQTNIARPKVVIIGAGFGGLRAARTLADASVDITVIDRSNHHLFQPLLYQVATAGLSPADISAPIRYILRHQHNASVMLAEVTGIDMEAQQVQMEGRSVPYDYLIVATGATHAYFGHDEWEEFAPGLKTITDATTIRRRILLAFEAAEIEPDPEKRKALLTFVLVGAGPTGVEMAGAIAELAHKALAHDFRNIDPASAHILLVEASPRGLLAFPEHLASDAQKALERLGVEVMTHAVVEQISDEGVVIGGHMLKAKTVIWTAGVTASPAGQWLDADVDRAGRVKVQPDLTLPEHDNVFVIGDTATLQQDGKPLPGVAPVAMQEGVYAASVIRERIAGKSDMKPFHYHNKGNLATVGRSFGLADLGTIKLTGFIGWMFWLTVHIFFLIGFRNRFIVLFQWAWAYLTYQRGARLIVQGDVTKNVFEEYHKEKEPVQR
ncbi:MAG TPA: FAD-dependent oxidoreductase [Ktedonobacter sp.]|nr:FAD-dependent oxidoreductase [Ktedonobacter sp.]